VPLLLGADAKKETDERYATSAREDWEVSMFTASFFALYRLMVARERFADRADFLRQMALETRSDVVRVGYMALLAEWLAEQNSREQKQGEPS
jgi:hypothetical protein